MPTFQSKNCCKLYWESSFKVSLMLYFDQSPELVARLKKLKAEQEKAEYDRMVSNVNKKVM